MASVLLGMVRLTIPSLWVSGPARAFPRPGPPCEPSGGTLYLVLANSLLIRRRLRALVVAGALALGLLAGPLALPAHAEGTASTFVVDASLDPDGTLAVKQTIIFTGAVPREVTQKFETREDLVGDRQYVQTMSGFTAAAGGAAVTPSVSTTERFTTVVVPTNGASEIQMGYTVSARWSTSRTARRCGSGCCRG